MKIIQTNIVMPIFTVAIGLASCESKKVNYLFGTYRIYEIVPIDTTSKISTRIHDASNWTISLKDSNNFEFKGAGEPVVGYWTFDTKKGKVASLYLSAPGHTIQAKFGGTTIYFDQPDMLFDSIFRRATFVRKK